MYSGALATGDLGVAAVEPVNSESTLPTVFLIDVPADVRFEVIDGRPVASFPPIASNRS